MSIAPRLRMVSRFQGYTGDCPWAWSAQDIEESADELSTRDQRITTGTLLLAYGHARGTDGCARVLVVSFR